MTTEMTWRRKEISLIRYLAKDHSFQKEGAVWRSSMLEKLQCKEVWKPPTQQSVCSTKRKSAKLEQGEVDESMSWRHQNLKGYRIRWYEILYDSQVGCCDDFRLCNWVKNHRKILQREETCFKCIILASTLRTPCTGTGPNHVKNNGDLGLMQQQ